MGQLRPLRLGQERTEAGDEARPHGLRIRRGAAGSHHSGRTRHSVHHGIGPAVQTGPRLDSRQPPSRQLGKPSYSLVIRRLFYRTRGFLLFRCNKRFNNAYRLYNDR